MKWSEIHSTINQARTDGAIPSGDTGNRNKRWIAILLVAIIVAVGVFFLVQTIREKRRSAPVLPVEQLQQISTFLDQNPPQPLSPQQADMVTTTLAQPASIDQNDVQALQDFINR